jgi:hypothetical protein
VKKPAEICARVSGGYFEPFAGFQKRTNFSEKPVFPQVKKADEQCSRAGEASLIVVLVRHGAAGG